MSIEVVIDCHRCHVTIARVGVLPGGQLSVVQRQADMEERTNHPRGAVLTRPWVPAEVPLSNTESRFNVWPCTCPARGCGGHFVLDSGRVRQLAREAMVKGRSLRWHPDSAAVARSEALAPYTQGSFWNGPRTERTDAARTMARSEPSPLSEDSIRPLRTPRAVG